ncbi:Flp pilus assembly protein TadG [Streptacidiphilus sp. MAP12-16]|uniref:TadE/TadG family type IV pilus assembly protein n=1 Tax=Streptacidiphilus sp. MAP12-16 TaxID=3156300 RepID=UPI003518B84D
MRSRSGDPGPRRGAVLPPIRDDRGSASTELALAAPLLVLMLLIVIGFGRAVNAHLDVSDAAQQAARAASLDRTPGAAAADAQQTAADVLARAGRSCHDLRTTADTRDFTPGGKVTVSVDCTTDLTDLGIPFPGIRHTTTGSASSPLDPYRAAPDSGGAP